MISTKSDYYKMVERFPLLHISGDEQLGAAQALIDELIDKLAAKTITEGEKDYLDALSDLVAAYESKRFASRPSMAPVELVKYLMEQNGLTQTDMAPLFGGQSRVSEFLTGKRELSKSQIEKLSERFRLSPSALLSPSGLQTTVMRTASTFLRRTGPEVARAAKARPAARTATSATTRAGGQRKPGAPAKKTSRTGKPSKRKA